jgi:hypothetical protein
MSKANIAAYSTAVGPSSAARNDFLSGAALMRSQWANFGQDQEPLSVPFRATLVKVPLAP